MRLGLKSSFQCRRSCFKGLVFKPVGFVDFQALSPKP